MPESKAVLMQPRKRSSERVSPKCMKRPPLQVPYAVLVISIMMLRVVSGETFHLGGGFPQGGIVPEASGAGIKANFAQAGNQLGAEFHLARKGRGKHHARMNANPSDVRRC